MFMIISTNGVIYKGKLKYLYGIVQQIINRRIIMSGLANRAAAGYFGNDVYKDTSGNFMTKNLFTPDSSATLNDLIRANNFDAYQAAGGQLDATKFGEQNALMNQGMSGIDMAKVGLGVGQLGLGLAGYLDNRKTAQKQRALMGEQLKTAKDERAAREGVRSGLASAFGMPKQQN